MIIIIIIIIIYNVRISYEFCGFINICFNVLFM